MFYFMKPLPDCQIDHNQYKPFIRNEWFRKNFMIFVYILQFLLLMFSIYFKAWNFSNIFLKILIFITVYILHEILHIIVVFHIGNISLTHSGIFFWLNTDAELTKIRFLTFMSLPFLLLSGVPAILTVFKTIPGRQYLLSAAWINAIVSGADIINSVLIMIKPKGSVFFRGYYKS